MVERACKKGCSGPTGVLCLGHNCVVDNSVVHLEDAEVGIAHRNASGYRELCYSWSSASADSVDAEPNNDCLTGRAPRYAMAVDS